MILRAVNHAVWSERNISVTVRVIVFIRYNSMRQCVYKMRENPGQGKSTATKTCFFVNI